MKRILFVTLTVSLLLSASAQDMPLVYEVENTCADCPKPSLPSINQLPVIQSLPDPFMRSDASLGRITTREEWRLRRAEIGAEIEHYELGTKPLPPDSLTASFSTADSILTVLITVSGKTLTLTSKITLPSGTGPFPAVIGAGGFAGTGSLPADIFTSRGIATIQYNVNQVAPWGFGIERGTGEFYKLYPDPKVGYFSAWAWGTSRIIDALEKLPELNIDLKRLAVTGCSYAGKIALFSGAYDERIALTIAIESGGGGYTTWRVTEILPGEKEKLSRAQGAPWYYQSLSQFNNAVTKLPYDHHELLAMIAPRALFVTGNPDFEWLADESGHVGSHAARQVWTALGVSERFGFSIVGGHNHCALPESQRPQVEAFVEKFLLGNQSANTFISTSPYRTNLSSWITWTTPDLAAVPSSVDDPEAVLDRFELMQNYPNPFNPTTMINFQLPVDSWVTLGIYDLLGREVALPLNKKIQAGSHSVEWDATDIPGGVYFYRLSTDDYMETKRLLLLK